MPIEWLASLTGLQSPPATDLALETCWLVLTRMVSVDGGGTSCVAAGVSPPGKAERLRQILSKYLSLAVAEGLFYLGAGVNRSASYRGESELFINYGTIGVW